MSARELHALAKELGIQTSFVDATKRRRTARTETLLLAVSALLGEEVATPDAAPEALARWRAAEEAALVEPVLVAWDGRLPEIGLRGKTNRRVEVRLELDTGDEIAAPADVAHRRGGVAVVTVEAAVPFGAHRLVVEPGARRAAGEALVLSAPSRLDPAGGGPRRDWGVFLPLPALVAQHGWGIGDLTGLAELADWVRSLGGGVVASLPLLARFPEEASPYSPASRLFWDERSVDVERELAARPSTGARRRVRSARFARAIEELRASELVDHAEVARRKREVLERLAVDAGDDPEIRSAAKELPELTAYARFRAAGERWGLDWRSWPRAAREGTIRPRDVEPASVAYHRFAQIVADVQVAEAGRRSAEAGAGLYLDMPLGTHPDGFDVWRHRDDFVAGMNVGAPPDAFFPGGQDWGFPPVHPLRSRQRGYTYVRDCLRHVFRHAGIVRVDHVMGLHRLYWVPQGASSADGVYVRYPAEEWYAGLALEAHRHGTTVVGEDLGTVPPEVRAGMRRHGLLRSYVVQYEAVPGRDRLPPPPADALATTNTHDMPTFAAFWRGLDIADRLEDGLLDEPGAERETAAREDIRATLVATLRDTGLLEGGDPTDREALEATLVWLARSDAGYVVVNLEDLWGELRPVNVPGVLTRPNWRRKAARSLEDLREDRDVVDVLRRVDEARRSSEPIGGRAPGEEAA